MVKIFTEVVEREALDQIRTLASQPAFKDCKVRIMPDVHAGAGCVIGFTANLGDKVIPNIVGVDIGCGVRVVPIGKIDFDPRKLDDVIRKNIPRGMSVRENPYAGLKFDKFKFRCGARIKDEDNRIVRSLGTLGGGNHFIEVDNGEDGCKYLIIHTGSRNLGKQVANIYQDIAVASCGANKVRKLEVIERLKREGREKEIQTQLELLGSVKRPPRDLCYLEGEDRENYLHDMRICQKFAAVNRKLISSIICMAMGWDDSDSWECIHNYIDDKNMVRKGAVSAMDGERVIIPINMRDGCIIGRGKGNPDWNFSAPHGAGRIMSRAAARANISIDDFRDATLGIYTTTANKNTLDESPMAYKSIGDILKYIGDTVSVEEVVRPIYNFKADCN